MIKLSSIIKSVKSARSQLNSVSTQTEYFVIGGDISNLLLRYTRSSIDNCLYTEQYLHLSVSNACRCLDGFNVKNMDPINYISSSDIKNGFVDICHNRLVVATINLKNGNISKFILDDNLAEDKCPVEKS